MKFVNRQSTASDFTQIAQELTSELNEQFDLGFLFISAFDRNAAAEIAQKVKRKIKVVNFLGCTCAGIVSGNTEVEGNPSCVLFLAKFDNVRIVPFYLNQTQLDALETPEAWYKFLDVYPSEKPKIFAFPDSFLFDVNQFLLGLSTAYPESPVIGGLASGATEAHENILMINDVNYDQGVVGVIVSGDVIIDTVVSQGCKPIGKNYIVTKSEGNIIYHLGGRPLFSVLEEALVSANDRERSLAQEAIFVGIAMDEYKHKLERGDFLIRLLVGVDRELGAGAIADYVNQGQTIQFHIRDAIAATEDLNTLLKQQNERLQNKPQGALVFLCTGRGEGLFHEKNHDINIIQTHLGPVPACGFFCAGEIGPVSGKNYVHGFSSSIALFYPKH